MEFKETEFKLKDGRTALLRSPREEDAEEMLQFLIKACGETEFLLRFPEEWADVSPDQEKALLKDRLSDPNGMMIACLVDGKLAGNCQIAFHARAKTRHRASVAIALLREFWDLGIGTKMFEEMFRLAGERPEVRQIELDFIEGNDRARHLYEKMGFRITGVRPDAIRRKDGTFANEYMMVKML